MNARGMKVSIENYPKIAFVYCIHSLKNELVETEVSECIFSRILNVVRAEVKGNWRIQRISSLDPFLPVRLNNYAAV